MDFLFVEVAAGVIAGLLAIIGGGVWGTFLFLKKSVKSHEARIGVHDDLWSQDLGTTVRSDLISKSGRFPRFKPRHS